MQTGATGCSREGVGTGGLLQPPSLLQQVPLSLLVSTLGWAPCDGGYTTQGLPRAGLPPRDPPARLLLPLPVPTATLSMARRAICML